MATKKQLEQEIADLRAQLYQERSDFANARMADRQRFSEMLREKTRVKQVLRQHDGYFEAMMVLAVEQCNDGYTVRVA